MSLPVASALGLCHGAGRIHPSTLRSLFGAHGAGQVLSAATQSFAQYNPPPQNPPIGSALQARPDITQTPPPTPTRQTSPAPQPPAAEHEGDTGKLKMPLIVGGFLILLIALYFIAK